jgi:hypothetical protein
MDFYVSWKKGWVEKDYLNTVTMAVVVPVLTSLLG